jgi:tight adherence protein B
MIIVIVFIGVFAIVALVAFGSMGASRGTRQAAATLDSVLRTDARENRQLKLDIRKDEQLSSIPWLNQKLVTLELASFLKRMLSQAALNWSPGLLLTMTAAGLFIPAYIVYVLAHSLALALVAGLVIGMAPFLFVVIKRKQRFGAFEKKLPDALDMMVSGLRAGHSLLAAMALVARECPEPLGGEFKICFEEQNYGLELKAALDNLINRVPLQDLKIVTTAIIIQKESGGNLAEVLDKTAQVIRDRFRLKKQIMVHTAQGRLTGVILTLLPIGLGAAIYAIDPDMISLLWHRDIGIKMMWVSACMTIVGGFVIYKIVDIDV